MKLILASSHNIGSYIIRLFTFSKWSHVAIMLDEFNVIDSTAKYGVRIQSMDYFKSRHFNLETIEVDLPNFDNALSFAYKQVGKKYDWSAIFGLIFQRNWQEADKWFCAELAEAICIAGGRQRFRDEVSRITPQQTWAVK